MILTGDEAPKGAIGNLLFTSNGVYAEYLLSGMPFIFQRKEVQTQVADVHADLLRALPSGPLWEGLTAPVAIRNVTRRMIFAHPDLHPDNTIPGEPMPPNAEEWVEHCRLWTPALQRRGHRRRVFFLSLPLDYGQGGTTAGGSWQRRLDSIIGHDKDTDAALATTADARRAGRALPGAFSRNPLAAEQIWWHWNYIASRGVWQQPLPTQPLRPAGAPARSAFTAVCFDPAAAAAAGPAVAGRPVRHRCVRPHLPRRRRRRAGLLSGVHPAGQFPDTGIAWPESPSSRSSTTSPARVSRWTGRSILRSPPPTSPGLVAHNTIVNIRDQARQRGPPRRH